MSAALQALPGLGLAVATTYPVGSSPWGYDLPFFLIQACPSALQCTRHLPCGWTAHGV